MFPEPMFPSAYVPHAVPMFPEPMFPSTYVPRRDLARNEEFSEIAVINIFFTVLKKKTVICGGGLAGKISR